MFWFPGVAGSENIAAVFQTYEIPLAMLESADLDFDVGHIAQGIFRMDADPEGAGSGWLDEIGFRSMPGIFGGPVVRVAHRVSLAEMHRAPLID